VYLDATNGRITAVANSSTLIAGIAMEDASGTTSTVQKVQVIYPGDQLIVRCYDASDAAETASSNFKASFSYDIEVDANGVAYAEVDSEHATTEELIFVESVFDALGDATNDGIFVVEAVASNFGSAG
jgi:hypothetical protein